MDISIHGEAGYPKMILLRAPRGPGPVLYILLPRYEIISFVAFPGWVSNQTKTICDKTKKPHSAGAADAFVLAPYSPCFFYWVGDGLVLRTHVTTWGPGRALDPSTDSARTHAVEHFV